MRYYLQTAGSAEAEEALESVAHDEGRFLALSSGSGSAATQFIDTWHVRDYLGSVRTVLDITRDTSEVNDPALAILEQNDYLPFGTRIDLDSLAYDQSNRYRFNGKEEQTTGGIGLTDYGARYYDNFLPRWTTPDPLAEKYYSISPYAFCNNNPVNFVDPDGEDVWEINSDGIITWVEESDEHRLYFIDAEGNRSDNYVTVNNRRILDAFSDKVGTASYSTYSSIDDVYKVFHFAANNSDVEWVVHRGEDNIYTIGTMHDKNSSGTWGDYGINKPIASVHSHPGLYNEYTEEIESMGYFNDILLGDRANVVYDVNVNGKQTRYNYVYFKHNGHLYHVEYYRPRFIKSITNYKQFYFGTLNHQ